MKQHTLVSGGVRGTLPWMAPELLSGKSHMVSEKVRLFLQRQHLPLVVPTIFLSSRLINFCSLVLF